MIKKVSLNKMESLLAEQVKKDLFKDRIREMIRESIFEIKKKKKKKHKKKHRKFAERKNDKKSSFTVGGDRQYVMDKFDNDGLDLAQYAYKLYPGMDKATARSKFYKKLDNDKVEDGYSYDKDYHYSFDDDEITTLVDLLDDKL